MTVLPTDPNGLMKSIHDRMSVVLPGDTGCEWLYAGTRWWFERYLPRGDPWVIELLGMNGKLSEGIE